MKMISTLTRGIRNSIKFGIAGFLLTVMLVTVVPKVWAGEGGGSHYVPGTQGDFAMALIGPAGWYIRNDLAYIDGDINSVTLGNRIYTSANQTVWANTTKGIYLAESGLLGGRFGAILALPVVIYAKVSGILADPIPLKREGNRSGLADINLTTIMNWKHGNFNYSAGLGIYAPTGSYDADRMVNLGRNYWSFDPSFAFTWLNAKRGHEVSLSTGYMINTKNNDTNYESGDEFHFDFNIAQHFSGQFGLGLVGYYYKQVTGDDGPFLDYANQVLLSIGRDSRGSFRGEAFGVGPALKYSLKIGDQNINIIAKWLHDFIKQNRFTSETFICSVSLKF